MLDDSSSIWFYWPILAFASAYSHTVVLLGSVDSFADCGSAGRRPSTSAPAQRARRPSTNFAVPRGPASGRRRAARRWSSSPQGRRHKRERRIARWTGRSSRPPGLARWADRGPRGGGRLGSTTGMTVRGAPEIDTCIVGGGMYARIRAGIGGRSSPTQPASSPRPTAGVRGGRLCPVRRSDPTRRAVENTSARCRDLEAGADRSRRRGDPQLKRQPGKNIHAVGGAALVSSPPKRGPHRRNPPHGASARAGPGQTAVQGRARSSRASDLVDSRRLSSGPAQPGFHGNGTDACSRTRAPPGTRTSLGSQGWW